MNPPNTSILIITGGLISHKDRSFREVLSKLIQQHRNGKSMWLEHRIKSSAAKPILLAQLEKRKSGNWSSGEETFQTPELSEVVLSTLLEKENIPFEVSTFSELLGREPSAIEKLKKAPILFLSTTFLRDMSELKTVVQAIRKPHQRLILGGALTGILDHIQEEIPNVDLISIGYGEETVPKIAEWIRSDFKILHAPTHGSVTQEGNTWHIRSGVPQGKSLDHLPRPEWKITFAKHGRQFPLIHYESVRGCPYRCRFCNYPYLFADSRFRYRSAQAMADDWEYYYRELKIQTISCLDSLFTMPKARLIEFCNRLIEKQLPIQWICYARASDLVEFETVELMRKAGCIQVQIGVESADPGILAAMDKRTTPEDNVAAIKNCRSVGITSVISLIVGYPGETAQTLERTFEFMKNAQPDFYFLAAFSTRALGVPILSPPLKAKYGLITHQNDHSVAPYWMHSTMSCDEVGKWIDKLNQRIAEERLSLDAAVFYSGITHYSQASRPNLLDFQYRMTRGHRWVHWLFGWINRYLDYRLKRDCKNVFKESLCLKSTGSLPAEQRI